MRALDFDACFKHLDDLCDDVEVRSLLLDQNPVVAAKPMFAAASRKKSRTSIPLVKCNAEGDFDDGPRTPNEGADGQ